MHFFAVFEIVSQDIVNHLAQGITSKTEEGAKSNK
jgi:hypothetical protein